MADGYNPRAKAARRRTAAAKRFAAQGAECGICHGARGPIRYDQPRNHMFPLSLAIDEIHPVSRWEEFGYQSREACATDPSNWQPAHWICNAAASDKRKPLKRSVVIRDASSGTF